MSLTDLQLELQLERLERLGSNVMSVTDFQLADRQTDRNISDRHYITMQVCFESLTQNRLVELCLRS